MRLLLDSHVLVWWGIESARLAPAAMKAVSDGDNEAFVSAATIWELSIKQSTGRLRIDLDIRESAARNGFTELPVTGAHAAAVRDLPFHHKDPFDRLLIAQAKVEGLTLVTADRAVMAYDVPILRAED